MSSRLSALCRPGTLARTYASLGGKVKLMGKPDVLIYDVCLDSLGLQAKQVLAIGDSLMHDVAGGCGVAQLS